jgi:hypothetical protein
MRRKLAIAGLVLAVGGCGGGGDGGGEPKAGFTSAKHRAPTAAEARAIRATIAQLEAAIAHGDADVVCSLYTEDARKIDANAYASCETAVRSDLEGARPPKLAVGRIAVSSDPAERPRSVRASVEVTSIARGRDPMAVNAVLVKEGSKWRLDETVLDYVEPGE